MARTKSPVMRREPSDIHSQSNGKIHQNGYISEKVEEVKSAVASTEAGQKALEIAQEPGVMQMAIAVAGIYGALYVSETIADGVLTGLLTMTA